MELKTLAVIIIDTQHLNTTKKGISAILDMLPCNTEALSRFLNLTPAEIRDLLKENIYVIPPFYPDGTWYLSNFGTELRDLKQKKESNSKIQDVYFKTSPLVERARIIAMPKKEEAPVLINGSLEHLKEAYITWLKNDVHFLIKKTVSVSYLVGGSVNNFYEKSDFLFRRAAKRGNAEYIRSIKERIQTYNDKLPSVRFFNPRSRDRQKTPMLYMVLTSNPRKFKSRFDAWDDIGKRLNKFTSNLKRHFGGRVEITINGKTKIRHKPAKIHSSHSWECFYKKAKGYPHVNLIICFKDRTVDCFRMLNVDKKTGEKRVVWRMKDKHDIEKYWDSGFIDVYAISHVRGIDEDYIDDLNTDHPIRDGSVLSVSHMLKYMTKNIRDNDVDDKTVLLNSILWALRKRSFSLSQMFFDMVHEVKSDANSAADLINRLTNSNIFPLSDIKVETKNELIGIYPACSLRCSQMQGGRPPPSCKYNKGNEGFGCCPYE